MADMIERYTETTPEIIERDGRNYISGHFARYYDPSNPGTEYHLGDNRWERIAPGAFDSVIAGSDNIEVRYNHSGDYILGDTASGTATLRTDRWGGLYSVAYDPNDPDHAKVKAQTAKGLIRGASFAGRPADLVWTVEGDRHIVTIRRMETLRDVGPVRSPAYKATTAVVRSCEEIDKSYREWLETQRRIDHAANLS